jgi:hypothetical protein
MCVNRAKEAAVRTEMDKLGLVDDDDLHSLGAPSARDTHNNNNTGTATATTAMSLSARGRHLDRQVDDDVRALTAQLHDQQHTNSAAATPATSPPTHVSVSASVTVTAT